MSRSHTILRQVFDLNCRDASQGKVLLGRIEELYWQRILPEIQSVFDEMGPSGEDIVIERLEIDLGDFNEADFEQALVDEVVRALRAALHKALVQGGGGSVGKGGPGNAEAGSTSAAKSFFEDGKQREVQRLRDGLGEWEALIAFLETGLLPWWASSGEFKPWEVFLEEVTQRGGRMAAYLRREIGGEWHSGKAMDGSTASRVFARIGGAKDGRVYAATLELLLGEAASVVVVLLSVITEPSMGGVAFAKAELWSLRAAALRLGAAGEWRGDDLMRLEKAAGSSDAFDRLAEAVQKALDQPGTKSALIPINAGSESVRGKVLKMLEEWTRQRKEGRRPLEAEAKVKQQQEPENLADGSNPKSRLFPPVADQKLEQSGNPPQKDRSLSDEIFIPNAGLALVAAFLPSYFEHIGMLAGGQFRDEDARQRAVRLMEVIARGLHPCEEQDLAFNKLLAGLRMDTPLDMTLETGPDDLATADELLRSVIANWTVLGDIQPDQLRGGFLLREGALMAAGYNWKLRVDRKSYDVVLESLPWSMSIISLPWMAGLVFVEW